MLVWLVRSVRVMYGGGAPRTGQRRQCYCIASESHFHMSSTADGCGVDCTCSCVTGARWSRPTAVQKTRTNMTRTTQGVIVSSVETRKCCGPPTQYIYSGCGWGPEVALQTAHGRVQTTASSSFGPFRTATWLPFAYLLASSRTASAESSG